MAMSKKVLSVIGEKRYRNCRFGIVQLTYTKVLRVRKRSSVSVKLKCGNHRLMLGVLYQIPIIGIW